MKRGKGYVLHDFRTNGIQAGSVLASIWSSLGSLIMQAKTKGFEQNLSRTRASLFNAMTGIYAYFPTYSYRGF
jgi:hypothetical protein